MVVGGGGGVVASAEDARVCVRGEREGEGSPQKKNEISKNEIWVSISLHFFSSNLYVK